MRLDKDAKKLLNRAGDVVSAGFRAQQVTNHMDRLVRLAQAAGRSGGDLKALAVAAPGEVPDEVIAETAEQLGDIVWAAVLALSSMGLSAEHIVGLRREKMLGGAQPLPTVGYVATMRQMGNVSSLLAPSQMARYYPSPVRNDEE